MRAAYAIVCFLLVGLMLSACQRQSQSSSTSLTMTLRTEPAPPVVGKGQIEVMVSAPGTGPMTDARVEVEATMAHAGMKSSFATLQHRADGTYEGSLDWTMGGDWIVIVRVTPPSGTVVEQRFPVAGVRSSAAPSTSGAP